ncbi:hypothetical protein ACF1BN_14160 [Streptomyces sp. NPDC014861]|uniref:hypothetical protein n=1 Tax=Streptomyces sp. NPDC014861 TaxID=3364923 RepID=UPI0037031397
MDEPRVSAPAAKATGRFRSPPFVLGGFLLLLALVFLGSYALGAAVGPVGPLPDAPATTGPAPATEHSHHEGHTG